jgi:hypothetical protein
MEPNRETSKGPLQPDPNVKVTHPLSDPDFQPPIPETGAKPPPLAKPRQPGRTLLPRTFPPGKRRKGELP